MTPKDRPQHKSLARASVLVPLFLRHSVIHVLLTKRPEKLRTHAGEVCFPGGKQDPEDGDDDIETALREAREEVGLDPTHIKPVCRLESLESYTGLCVTPVVGLVDPAEAAEPANLTLSKAEVEAAFAVPLGYFYDETNLISKQDIDWRGEMFEMRTYHYTAECGRTFKIWGLTAFIAHQVAMIAMSVSNEPIIGLNSVLNQQLEERRPTLSGYMLRLEESSGMGGLKSFWSRRYFVLEGEMLHQYEGDRQATRKTASATKKNRLPLVDSDVSLVPVSKEGRYEFVVGALSGRVRWHLAAQTDDERQQWIRALQI
jgi:peroxisomal coenzyme A diphosphatase NUDT7